MARILVIDDETAIRSLLREALKGQGHEVAVAGTGAEALRVYGAGGFELVITDILMPDMDGLECIMALRRLKPDVRIIAMSGGSRRMDMDVLGVARRFGAFRTLAKPFPIREMLAAVHDALDPDAPHASE